MRTLPGIVGIIGYPLKHTLSPKMHTAAFARLKLNFRYVPFEVKPARLSAAIRGIQALGMVGVNVTIPHKETVMEFIDDIDKKAQKIGAVNTLLNVDGKLIGYNTDAPGFLKSIMEEGEFIPRGKKAVVFGAGGVARAITAALASSGIKRIVLTDINTAQAKILGRFLKRQFDCEITEYESGEDRALYWAIKDSDLLINATPVGLKPNETIPLMIKSLHKDLFVFDAVYASTRLIRTARKKKLQALNGLGMLVAQGAASFKIWTKKDPPVDVMRQAVESRPKK